MLLFSAIFLFWKKLRGTDGAWKKEWIVGLFLLKVSIGFFYGWASPSFLNAPDASNFFKLSEVISSALPEQPIAFIKLTLLPRPDNTEELLLPYRYQIPVWNNNGSYMMVRLHALMSVFSGGRYFVNIIFWNVLSTIGLVLLWRSVYFSVEQVNRKRWLQIFLCLNPPLLFWASGAHKEGIAILGIGILLFCLVSFKPKKTINYLFCMLGCLFISLLLYHTRHYYFAMFAVAVLIYVIYHLGFKKVNPVVYFTVANLLCFITIAFLDGLLNIGFLNKLINFRNEFVTITTGRSDFNLAVINTSWFALIKQLPQAIINPYLRPFPTDIIHFRSFLAVAESLLLAGFMVCLIIKTKWKKVNNTLPLLLISFGISAMLIIGLVVDNSGALVRYRSVPYSLLLLGLFVCYLTTKPNKQLS